MAKKFSTDETTTLAASLAFYSTLSLAPIIILFVAIASRLKFYSKENFLTQVNEMLGPQASQTIQSIIESSQEQSHMASVASWIGIVAMLFSASLVFGELQMALNKIFKARPPCEDAPSGLPLIVCLFVKQKIFYLLSVIGFIFLLMATTGFSTILFKLFHSNSELLIFMINVCSSLVIYSLIFSLMYHYIPHPKRPWIFCFYGGIITAIFFVLGTQLIGLYLRHSDIGLAFGASGSLLIFLVWVYYSSIVILVGAQISSLFITFHKESRNTI